MGCDRLEKLAISIPTDDIVSLPSFVEIIQKLDTRTTVQLRVRAGCIH